VFAEGDGRGASKGAISETKTKVEALLKKELSFLQKTTVEVLLKELYFLFFVEDDGKPLLQELYLLLLTEDKALLISYFLVFTEDNGRGAAEGTFFSCVCRRRR
jgi:hypothetical protein